MTVLVVFSMLLVLQQHMQEVLQNYSTSYILYMQALVYVLSVISHCIINHTYSTLVDYLLSLVNVMFLCVLVVFLWLSCVQ